MGSRGPIPRRSDQRRRRPGRDELPVTKAPAAPRWVTPAGDIVYAAVERDEVVCQEVPEVICYRPVRPRPGIKLEVEPDPEDQA